MALPVFAVTLFVSAFILFLVQPIVGKMILPKLGGTPQVWNTCMVFFQAVLLAGYAYTHFTSTRLSVRRQLLVHGLLLFIPIVFLVPPLGPLDVKSWTPPLGSNPILSTLGVLALVVGIPFFVVATSAPLLQKWFAYTGDKAAKDPYFLYAASNAGSLLALLAYPIVLEPLISLDAQALTFAVGYIILLVLVLVCAVGVWQTAPQMRLAVADVPVSEAAVAEASSTQIAAGAPATSAAAASATAIKKPTTRPPAKGAHRDLPVEPHGLPKTDEITGWRRLRWIALAAAPSSMMLGVTAHITTDLSPIPLFWLIPLTLYLLSFILVFARWPVVWTGTPHTAMLFAQPVALGFMIYFNMVSPGAAGLLDKAVIFNVLAFFLTAMVCHGELARDRPSTRHLTEFYLLMSVGGVVGGIFNGLVAPVLFKMGNWEFPLAVFAACVLRPRMKESGWADDLVAGYLESKPAAPHPQPKKAAKHPPRPAARMERNPSFHNTMDGVLAGAVLVLILILAFPLARALRESLPQAEDPAWSPANLLMFGIPVLIGCFFFNRPLRFGGAAAAILLVHALYYQATADQGTIHRGRSYFGIFRVREDRVNMPDSSGNAKPHAYRNLMHGNIDHGKNFRKPADEKLWGNPKEDYSRLATTYYHRLGPGGRVMSRFNWFYGAINASGLRQDLSKEWDLKVLNTYESDARMPASQVGLAVSPLSALVGVWSEPPYATIGLGTGTMASYGRPFQHVHFYEIDDHIRQLSLPLGRGETHFTYLRDAMKRGCYVQVLMGDARLRMAMPYRLYDEEKEKLGRHTRDTIGGGPDNFYHMMVVDAFSSDAIPVHLLTREAFIMYFQKLHRDGVLAVHTSNRYVDLVKVVADVANDIRMVELTDFGDSKLTQRTQEKKVMDRLNEQLKVEGKRPVQYKEDPSPLVARRGHDNAPGYGVTRSGRGAGNQYGHYTSEWVMVGRNRQIINDLPEPTEYAKKMREEVAESQRLGRPMRAEPYWTTPAVEGRHVWTDDYQSLLRVLR